MSTTQTLQERSNNQCELCHADNQLTAYEIPPNSDGSAEQSILLCQTCRNQINEPTTMDVNHWRCLNDCMWSQVPAVQVMVWRQLNQLSEENWAQDALNMLYLEDEILSWAKALSADEQSTPTLDSNGALLKAGDTVTLIKDLNVKGAGFTAKRGTAVRGISLTDNPEQIEGKVNGVRIVLLTKFLKKS
jgi:protein PhnA